jgi:glycerol-3-phosphate dehydrogenase
LSYQEVFNPNHPDPDPLIFTTRQEVIQKIEKKKVCDVLVVGGGIHGAAFANIAAFNGLDTVLLEQSDYAFATSSRSTKLIHGGLRYLELFDFRQVLDGIKAREDLFEVAYHIVQPSRFLVPIEANNYWRKIKMSLGLKLYDLLIREKSRKHFWQNDLTQSLLKEADYLGAFNYCDGITEDARLVIEHILAARQEGARCLNYAKVVSLQQKRDGVITVGWTDLKSGHQHEITAGIVVNCAGPWVAETGRIKPGILQNQIKYSQGSHVIFNRFYDGPCLFLPRKEKSRYLFVLPHIAGTLVGTTERQLDKAPLEAWPSKDEINEIFSLLENDFKFLGLNRKQAHYCYAGVRTLPLRKKTNLTSQISRRHIWDYSNGVLSLLGGKYTDARLTAYEGIQKVFKLSNVLNIPENIIGRKLPGAGLYEQSVQEFRKKAESANVPEEIIKQTIARKGSLVRYFDYFENPYRVIANTILAGEVEFALRAEQAENLDDILRRRCMLEYHYEHGSNAVSDIQLICEKYISSYDKVADLEKFKQRIQQIKTLLE